MDTEYSPGLALTVFDEIGLDLRVIEARDGRQLAEINAANPSPDTPNMTDNELEMQYCGFLGRCIALKSEIRKREGRTCNGL